MVGEGVAVFLVGVEEVELDMTWFGLVRWCADGLIYIGRDVNLGRMIGERGGCLC